MSVVHSSVDVSQLLQGLRYPSDDLALDLYSLLELDWRSEVLTSWIPVAVEDAVKFILHASLSPDSTQHAFIGRALQLLVSLPKEALIKYLVNSPSTEDPTEDLVYAIQHSVDNFRSYYPYELSPSSAACTVAGSILSGLLKDHPDIFHRYASLHTIATIAYQVWIWADSPRGMELWLTYPWRTVGRKALRLLQLLLMDEEGRKYFVEYCDDDYGERWTLATAWLVGRGAMLAKNATPDVDDIGGILDILSAFVDASDYALRVLFEGRILQDCLLMLGTFTDLTDTYFLDVGIFFRILCRAAEDCEPSDYRIITRRLISRGILVHLQEVILYSDQEEDDVEVDKAWEYLRLITASLADFRTLPHLYKAFSSLPTVDESIAGDHALDFWNQFTGTLHHYVQGYLVFVDKEDFSVCDNMKVRDSLLAAENVSHYPTPIFHRRTAFIQSHSLLNTSHFPSRPLSAPISGTGPESALSVDVTCSVATSAIKKR